MWLLWFAKPDIISTLKVNPGVTLIENISECALFWTLEHNLDLFQHLKINQTIKKLQIFQHQDSNPSLLTEIPEFNYKVNL